MSAVKTTDRRAMPLHVPYSDEVLEAEARRLAAGPEGANPPEPPAPKEQPQAVDVAAEVMIEASRRGVDPSVVYTEHRDRREALAVAQLFPDRRAALDRELDELELRREEIAEKERHQQEIAQQWLGLLSTRDTLAAELAFGEGNEARIKSILSACETLMPREFFGAAGSGHNIGRLFAQIATVVDHKALLPLMTGWLDAKRAEIVANAEEINGFAKVHGIQFPGETSPA